MQLIKEGQPKTLLISILFTDFRAKHLNPLLKPSKQQQALKPDRLVTFSYAHLPTVFKNQKKLEKRGLPQSDEKVKMYHTAAEILSSSGYKAIGMDHFVLPDDELYVALASKQLHRNFQGYCTRATTGQVYAVGVSAISQLEQAYLQNTKSVDAYIVSLESDLAATVKGYQLNEQEMIVREGITELMCNKSLNLENLAKRRNISFEKLKNTLHLMLKTKMSYQ